MKSVLAATCAAAMLAVSSMAFAADDSGSVDGVTDGNNMNNAGDTTGSIEKDSKLTPEQMEQCKLDPTSDPSCSDM